MIFAGTVTDGEFCSLRSRGETRALHIWQLIHDARESVQRLSKRTLLEMLILINSKFSAVFQNPPKLVTYILSLLWDNRAITIGKCNKNVPFTRCVLVIFI